MVIALLKSHINGSVEEKSLISRKKNCWGKRLHYALPNVKCRTLWGCTVKSNQNSLFSLTDLGDSKRSNENTTMCSYMETSNVLSWISFFRSFPFQGAPHVGKAMSNRFFFIASEPLVRIERKVIQTRCQSQTEKNIIGYDVEMHQICVVICYGRVHTHRLR